MKIAESFRGGKRGIILRCGSLINGRNHCTVLFFRFAHVDADSGFSYPMAILRPCSM